MRETKWSICNVIPLYANKGAGGGKFALFKRFEPAISRYLPDYESRLCSGALVFGSIWPGYSPSAFGAGLSHSSRFMLQKRSIKTFSGSAPNCHSFASRQTLQDQAARWPWPSLQNPCTSLEMKLCPSSFAWSAYSGSSLGRKFSTWQGSWWWRLRSAISSLEFTKEHKGERNSRMPWIHEIKLAIFISGIRFY